MRRKFESQPLREHLESAFRNAVAPILFQGTSWISELITTIWPPRLRIIVRPQG